MARARRVRLCVVLSACMACSGTDSVSPLASFTLELDAPFCGGGVFTIAVSVDRVPVRVDTLRLDGVLSHRISRAHSLAPGQHVLGARWFSEFGTNYVWPDTIVMVAAGQALNRSLPLYCS